MANRNDFFFKAGPQASLINWLVVGVAMVNKSRGSFFFLLLLYKTSHNGDSLLESFDSVERMFNKSN